MSRLSYIVISRVCWSASRANDDTCFGPTNSNRNSYTFSANAYPHSIDTCKEA